MDVNTHAISVLATRGFCAVRLVIASLMVGKENIIGAAGAVARAIFGGVALRNRCAAKDTAVFV
jgi:hypothetical protein